MNLKEVVCPECNCTILTWHEPSELVGSARKINAIKHLRQCSPRHDSLVEAKRYIDTAIGLQTHRDQETKDTKTCGHGIALPHYCVECDGLQPFIQQQQEYADRFTNNRTTEYIAFALAGAAMNFDLPTSTKRALFRTAAWILADVSTTRDRAEHAKLLHDKADAL